MILIVLTTDKTRQKKQGRGREELEVDALYVSEKYSNISPVCHIFNKNLIPIVFEPAPI
jgi:hypothetical protein